jgi:DNA gyrase subunit A
VINIRNIERNGPVVLVMEVCEDDEVILISGKGMIIRVPASGIRVTRRMTQGVRLMEPPEDDVVADAARLSSEAFDEEDQEEATEPEQGQEAARHTQ